MTPSSRLCRTDCPYAQHCYRAAMYIVPETCPHYYLLEKLTADAEADRYELDYYADDEPEEESDDADI